MTMLILGGLVGVLLLSRRQHRREARLWQQAYLLEHANHLATIEAATDALTAMQEEYVARPRIELDVPLPGNDPRLN